MRFHLYKSLFRPAYPGGWGAFACLFALTAIARATDPFSVYQETTVVNYLIVSSGPRTGEIILFGGGFAPTGSLIANGQFLDSAIPEYADLFGVMGYTYGGDGDGIFALPDFNGRTAIATGTGAGLTPRSLGEEVGYLPGNTLITGNLPVASGGSADPVVVMQPSLAVNFAVATEGAFPFEPVNLISSPHYAGQVSMYASSFMPSSSVAADGQELSTSGYGDLHDVIGDTYGSTSGTTFAVPDLRGRAPTGAAASASLGTTSGAETITLETTNLPVPEGDGTAINLTQPTLELNYIIAYQGLYPGTEPESHYFDGDESPFIGEIALIAGSDIPDGWLLADGSILDSLNPEYSELSALLVNTYGGNGLTTFALPDLVGRLAVGYGDGDLLGTFALGDQLGADSLVLSESQVPAAVPEPGILLYFLGGLLLLLCLGRKRLSAIGLQ